MERKKIILIIIATLIVGAFIGWLLKPTSGETASAHQHEVSENQIWTCSMHPQVRRNEPGDCPICGMDLIPAESDAAGETNPDSYKMSKEAMALANITTMLVGRQEASREIRLNGRMEVDERNVYAQSTHIPGRIEQLFINFTGENVRRGQTLATVYSPQLVTAQQELLQAYRIRENQPELYEAAQEKLRNWRISQNQINQILNSGNPIQRFPITADVNGVVTEKLVSLGDYVERGMPIYQIADLSKLWILFDLYESDLAWVQEGSRVKYTVRSLPGQEFEGRISFIDPVIDPGTRVATARVEVDNSNGRLKPEMFVSGVVENPVSGTDGEQIVVPKSAVLWTGTRSVVYVKEDAGNQVAFALREITLGPSLGDAYVVENGLETGEELVVNGTFTVDAAAQLAGKPSMMSPRGEASNASGQVQAIQTSEAEKRNLRPLLANYLELKNALVNDDFSKSKNEVKKLQQQLKEIRTNDFSAENLRVWNNYRQELELNLNEMENAADLEAIRSRFDEFSEVMISLVKVFKINENQIYVQRCPMADNDRGANWLSTSDEVRNPYFGSAMLRCGEVTDTLK